MSDFKENDKILPTLKSDNLISAQTDTDNLSDKKESIFWAYSELGNTKGLFLALIIMLAANISLMFSNMLSVKINYSSMSGSYLEFFKFITNTFYNGDLDATGDIKWSVYILYIGMAVTGLSLILTALPVLAGKKYKRKFLILNYISMIFNFFRYFLYSVYFIGVAFVSKEKSYLADLAESGVYILDFTVNFWAYLYLAETIATIIITIIFSKKLKKKQKKALLQEAQN